MINQSVRVAAVVSFEEIASYRYYQKYKGSCQILKGERKWSGVVKVYQCRPPTSATAIIKAIGCDKLIFFENGMYCSAHGTGSFAMDYTDMENIFCQAELEIMGNQAFDISGMEGVKV